MPTWEVTPNTRASIDSSGKLTILENESDSDMTYTVKYTDDSGVSATKTIIQEGCPPSTKYMTFTALEDGIIYFQQSTATTNTPSFSIDDGATWDTLDAITVDAGMKVLVKGNFTVPNDSIGVGSFYSTCPTNVSGNIMSLLYGDDFVGKSSTPQPYPYFRELFAYNTRLVSAKKLVLPTNPLPNMFKNMFNGCTSLEEAPELPATTVTPNCYQNMFINCTSLSVPPSELPATKAESGCYQNMFYGCTNLRKSPKIKCEELAAYCFKQMFWECTSLNEIWCKAYIGFGGAPEPTKNWVKNVASNGMFHHSGEGSVWTTGTDGIPSGWSHIPW